MTREEAIRRIQDFMGWFKKDKPIIVALKMAIQALSQEPCEDCRNCKKWDDCECGKKGHINGTSIGYSIGECKDYESCDDAISREDVLKEIIRFSTEEGASVECQQLYCDVNNMPSVTHKSGKWILLDECANSGYYCSNCQKKLVKEGWSNTVKKIKYCPNCGAKMESEE